MTHDVSDQMIDDLFLFAHQDDEFSAVHLIKQGIGEGRRLFFAFLTDGQTQGGPDSHVRNQETITALGTLGVRKEQIAFVGSASNLPDGRLYQNLQRGLESLGDAIGDRQIGRVILPAWEGGHQDHDAVPLIELALAQRRKCTEVSRQLPFYRARPGFPGIVMFAPLAANGGAFASRQSLSEIWSHLALSRYYPTQAHYFLGILPLTLLHYLLDRHLYSQPVSIDRVLERPTERIKYEARHQLSFADFQSATQGFIEAEILQAHRSS